MPPLVLDILVDDQGRPVLPEVYVVPVPTEKNARLRRMLSFVEAIAEPLPSLLTGPREDRARRQWLEAAFLVMEGAIHPDPIPPWFADLRTLLAPPILASLLFSDLRMDPCRDTEVFQAAVQRCIDFTRVVFAYCPLEKDRPPERQQDVQACATRMRPRSWGDKQRSGDSPDGHSSVPRYSPPLSGRWRVTPPPPRPCGLGGIGR